MVRSLIWDRLRVLSPHWLRRWIKNRRWFIPVSSRLFGNTVYSRSYYDDLERLEAQSAEHIAEWIVRNLRPRSAIDIGCGSGLLMRALHTRGVEVRGVDLSPVAIGMVKAKGLAGSVVDLTDRSRELPGGPYDLAISCEVAEHLEQRYADLFVERLTGVASRVYLTAAEPNPRGGPGLYHYNEQPNEYWVALCKDRGFELDESLTRDARKVLASQEVIEHLARPIVLERK